MLTWDFFSSTYFHHSDTELFEIDCTGPGCTSRCNTTQVEILHISYSPKYNSKETSNWIAFYHTQLAVLSLCVQTSPTESYLVTCSSSSNTATSSIGGYSGTITGSGSITSPSGTQHSQHVFSVVVTNYFFHSTHNATSDHFEFDLSAAQPFLKRKQFCLASMVLLVVMSRIFFLACC